MQNAGLTKRPIIIALIVGLTCAAVQLIPFGGNKLNWEAPVTAAIGGVIGVWIAVLLRRIADSSR